MKTAGPPNVTPLNQGNFQEIKEVLQLKYFSTLEIDRQIQSKLKLVVILTAIPSQNERYYYYEFIRIKRDRAVCAPPSPLPAPTLPQVLLFRAV